MVFIKINASLVFLIILLSLEGFYSMDKGKGIDLNLSLTGPEESMSSYQESANRTLHQKSPEEKQAEYKKVIEDRKRCLAQIIQFFDTALSPEQHVYIAFDRYTISGEISNYEFALEYYTYLYKFVTPMKIRSFWTFFNESPRYGQDDPTHELYSNAYLTSIINEHPEVVEQFRNNPYGLLNFAYYTFIINEHPDLIAQFNDNPQGIINFAYYTLMLKNHMNVINQFGAEPHELLNIIIHNMNDVHDRLYNAYFNLNKDIITATGEKVIIDYFELILGNYLVNLTPFGKKHYKDPNSFCRKIIKMPKGVEGQDVDTEFLQYSNFRS